MITSFDQLDLTKQYTYADYLKWQFKERLELIKGHSTKCHRHCPGGIRRLYGSFLRPSETISTNIHARHMVRHSMSGCLTTMVALGRPIWLWKYFRRVIHPGS